MQHSGPAQNSLKFKIRFGNKTSTNLASIVQNTVLAQDVWLEENNILDRKSVV